MPTNRRYRTRTTSQAVDDIAREHLELGGHLLAGRCWICERGAGAAVRSTWRLHRAAIVRGWKAPFPCWASIVLDGETMPPLDPGWSAHHQDIARLIAGRA